MTANTSLPRISVVTSSYNQGAYIERTIESVLAQHYPNLEHIVVDGMSSDQTVAILARYPHLRVIREPDSGQADAINKGFRVATGDIFCFLNSDDTLLPGALQRVAQTINPAAGRHVVLGRCQFIDEADRFLGIEHPSAFESHERVLKIWLGHSLPQPAIFWTREVWQRCGPLNERERLMLDYDLFCRFSKSYHFHFIDQVLATYRLQPESKTSSVTDQQRLEQAITVSRRYWGPASSPQFWRIFGSYLLFRINRRQRALQLLRAGRQLWRRNGRVQALPQLLSGSLLAPDVVAQVWLWPRLKVRLWNLLQQRNWARYLPRLPQRKVVEPHPQTLAWRSFTELHSDGWAGPLYVTTITIGAGQRQLQLQGATAGVQMPRPLAIDVYLNGEHIGQAQAGGLPEFDLKLPLGALPPGKHEVRLVANTYIVPHEHFGVDDYRPLSYKLAYLAAADSD